MVCLDWVCLDDEGMLQNHFDLGPDGKRNLVAAREQDFREAEPQADGRAWTYSDADVSDGSEQDADAGGPGNGVDVGVDLVDGLDRAVVASAVFCGAGQALQVGSNRNCPIIGENELRESQAQLSTAMRAPGPAVFLDDAEHSRVFRDGDAIVGDHRS